MTRIFVVVGFALALLAGCTPATPQHAATPAATAGTATTKEVERVSAVRPIIDRMTQALASGDLPASRDAYEAYDAAWNGIEVYINFRSRDLYGIIEQDLQASIEKGLQEPQPDLPRLASQSRSLAARYDEAIALVKKGPPLSPLFDDVATLRITRSDLRIASDALGDGNLPKVKQNYPKAQALIKMRSASDEQETTAALTALNNTLEKPGATVADVKPAITALMDRYNFGVNLYNAAARNADVSKTAPSDADKQALAGLNTIQVQLNQSKAAWDAGRYPQAADAANTAAGAGFAAVQAALQAKSSDPPLQMALAAYAQAVANSGDAGKVQPAYKSASEQLAIAQQVVAGQFWTDPQLQRFLAGLPKA
jgi:hypothetical protein